MITTVTMNASLDKAYFMEHAIENGTVMRVARTRTSAGGKGLNVARAAALCGAKVQATGLTGGYNGQQLEALLDKDGIPHRFGKVEGETRCCINILDERYGSTEYLEPGCNVTEAEQNQFKAQFPSIIQDSMVVTISGSLPQGIGADFYAWMIRTAKEMGKIVLLDTSGKLLSQGISAGPTLVKPNQDELEQLFGTRPNDLQSAIQCAEKIREAGVSYVVLSLGAEGALLVCEEGVYKGTSPKVKAVNTVGCGDSMLGALAVAFERNYPVKEALRYAMAVAAANAMSPNTGDFEPLWIEQLLPQANVELLP